MRGRCWFHCLFAALVTACFLALPAAPSAQAQTRGAHGVNSSFDKAIGTGGIGRGHNGRFRHGKLGLGKFDRRHGRSKFTRRRDEDRNQRERLDAGDLPEDHNRSDIGKRFDHGFRNSFFPTYGSRYRRYDDYGDYESPDDSSGQAVDRSDPGSETQPQQIIPVTPKWIRVDVQVPAEGSSTGEDTYAKSSAGGSCLDGKTEITVDGKPVDAFREDCRRAN